MKAVKKTGDAHVDAVMTDNFRLVPQIVSCGRVDVVTAGAPIVVSHKLGSVPEFFFIMPWSGVEVTAADDLQAQWTKEVVVVLPSAAVTLTLYVGKF